MEPRQLHTGEVALGLDDDFVEFYVLVNNALHVYVRHRGDEAAHDGFGRVLRHGLTPRDHVPSHVPALEKLEFQDDKFAVFHALARN